MYGAGALALNAVQYNAARIATAATELFGLHVATRQVDEASMHGAAAFTRLEQVASRHADSLATEALVGGAAALVLLIFGIAYTRGARAGLRGVQLLLLVKLTQAVALAWLIGWRLGPEAVGVLTEVRDAFQPGSRDWEHVDALVADEALLHGGAALLGAVAGLPAAVLFWLSTLRVSTSWCARPRAPEPA